MSVKCCHGNKNHMHKRRACTHTCTHTESQAVIGDNSGSTPGNPHIIDGEGPDIFQRMPNNIPLIRRSAKFLRGAAGTWENSRDGMCKTSRLQLKIFHLHDSFNLRNRALIAHVSSSVYR